MPFKKNQNVLYVDRHVFRPAKVVQYDSVSNSYLVRVTNGDGSVRERETVPRKLVAHPENVNARLRALEKKVDALVRTRPSF